MECSINSLALSLLMKHLVIGQHLKTPNFSAFHWSPRGSLIAISQHFVASRVVHLPKSTETNLITESYQSGPNHQLLQLCTARTAWSDSDQAVRAGHSCKSWCLHLICLTSGRDVLITRARLLVGHLTLEPEVREFNTWSSHILLFLLLLIVEGHLSVTGESMCTKHWLTA